MGNAGNNHNLARACRARVARGGSHRARTKRCVAAACRIYLRNRGSIGRLKAMCRDTGLAPTRPESWGQRCEVCRASLKGCRARHSPIRAVFLVIHRRRTHVVCAHDPGRVSRGVLIIAYRTSLRTTGSVITPPPLYAPSPSCL